MTSHGVPRPDHTVVTTEEGRRKELRKIEEYRALEDRIREAASARRYTRDSLDLTSQLLTKNPEYYTVWNDRRRILTELLPVQAPATAESEAEASTTSRQLLTSDLEFILPLLKKFPKCYWIWNHRIWVLQQTSERLPAPTAKKIWEAELQLVSSMLARDSRNFLGWNYRRFVVGTLQRLATDREDTQGKPPDPDLIEAEYAYTTSMIRKNLSNFSAWHNRSRLIPQLLACRNADDAARRKLFDEELELLKSALLQDPYDQSLWYYHEYLMSTLMGKDNGTSWVPFTNADREAILRTEIDDIRELLEDTVDCKWVYQHLLQYAEAYRRVDAGNAAYSTIEMNAWLDRLQQLDPLRRGRWNDWRRRLGI